MHIPDGFLDAKTCLLTAALAGAGLGVALRHARRTLSPRKIPLLGLSAAFVFAAQMINFPVAAGTSGHLLGGVLVAALLGPSAAVLVLATVLFLQCFAFADGGISALGANLFNMGMVASVGGWMVYALLARWTTGLRGRIAAAVVASWCSVVLAAMVAGAELAASGTVPWKTAVLAMGGVHALIGIGEGIITAMVLSAVTAARPELLAPAKDGIQGEPARGYRSLLAYGFLIALGIGLLFAPFSSALPDGLEKTAQRLGFAGNAESLQNAPLAGYSVPGIGHPALATALAAALGIGLIFAVGLLLARTVRVKDR